MNILRSIIDEQKKSMILLQIYNKSQNSDLINRIIFDLDDVDITLKEKNKILKFEKERIKNKPWIYTND